MPIIDFTKPFTILVAVVLFVLTTLLAKEMKNSKITAIMLGIFLIIIVLHATEYVFVNNITEEVLQTIARTITMDFIFILISFFAYLWMDDIEAKEKKKKIIDNSLQWFWKKV